MIPMFPFSINNALKLFTIEPFDEETIKERISQAVVQSLPNKRNIKFNAIVVLECDNEPRRTIIINEAISNSVSNGGTLNNQKVQVPFPNISTSDVTTTSNVLVSQQPVFPATLEGLQALLNLNRSNMSDGLVHNNISFFPIKQENVQSSINTEKYTNINGGGPPSRKRKSEKPCKIPQDSMTEFNGLDLSLGGRYESKSLTTTNVAIWPCPTNHQNTIPRIKRPPTLPGQKKTSKIFNCNQCKLQFNSLNALCKHTFSDHRAFRCTFCSANFTQRSNLQRHSLKHVGFKPFICNVCSKAYYRKDHLVRHIEVSHPGSDPKSNITVKLSSSECLEYLEKMQNNKMMEMANVAEGENHFLSPESGPNHITMETLNMKEEDSCRETGTVKSSPVSTDVVRGEYSPETLPPYDYTRETSLTDNDSESHEKLQISYDDVLIKEEVKEEDILEYQTHSQPSTLQHYSMLQIKEPLQGYPCVFNQMSLSGRSHD